MFSITARVWARMSSTVVPSASASGEDGEGRAGASVSDQVMTSALKYRLQAPLVDSLLESAGLPSHDPGSILKL